MCKWIVEHFLNHDNHVYHGVMHAIMHSFMLSKQNKQIKYILILPEYKLKINFYSNKLRMCVCVCVCVPLCVAWCLFARMCACLFVSMSHLTISKDREDVCVHV